MNSKIFERELTYIEDDAVRKFTETALDRVIEVKYKEITTDKKTGLESLQFPVFCGLREIGKEPSYN